MPTDGRHHLNARHRYIIFKSSDIRDHENLRMVIKEPSNTITNGHCQNFQVAKRALRSMDESRQDR